MDCTTTGGSSRYLGSCMVSKYGRNEKRKESIAKGEDTVKCIIESLTLSSSILQLFGDILKTLSELGGTNNWVPVIGIVVSSVAFLMFLLGLILSAC